MFTAQARELLQKPLIARMSVIDSEGFPHTVPVWFAMDGDDAVIISVRDTRKVGHIQANPKGALVVGGDSGAGYLIKGEFTIEPDTNQRWMKYMVYRYEPKDRVEQIIVEWSDLDIIVLRLKPRKVIKVA
jgi:nitroimidazol reductase NimA-like FMN-containing flavoprotein (pyridoxamine 5'-phosphate oxidase superfamily)